MFLWYSLTANWIMCIQTIIKYVYVFRIAILALTFNAFTFLTLDSTILRITVAVWKQFTFLLNWLAFAFVAIHSTCMALALTIAWVAEFAHNLASSCTTFAFFKLNSKCLTFTYTTFCAFFIALLALGGLWCNHLALQTLPFALLASLFTFKFNNGNLFFTLFILFSLLSFGILFLCDHVTYFRFKAFLIFFAFLAWFIAFYTLYFDCFFAYILNFNFIWLGFFIKFNNNHVILFIQFVSLFIQFLIFILYFFGNQITFIFYFAYLLCTSSVVRLLLNLLRFCAFSWHLNSLFTFFT